jgi:glyoxylase-like metal-dependent hydrolase (beta-lactamase superfamily II)
MDPASGFMYNVSFDNDQGPFEVVQACSPIAIDNDMLKIIEAPGHSPGSICLYSAEQHFLIGGDVLFNRSIGRTDLPGGNHQQLINSIRENLFVLPDETIVYSGHGDTTTIGEEKQFNPFLQ